MLNIDTNKTPTRHKAESGFVTTDIQRLAAQAGRILRQVRVTIDFMLGERPAVIAVVVAEGAEGIERQATPTKIPQEVISFLGQLYEAHFE